MDPATNEYYYHFFYKEQPDLNWENPEVKQAMFAMVRYWLEMGVDGFRLDAVGTIFELEGMPDHECKYTQDELYRMERLASTAAEHGRVAKEYYEAFHRQWDQPRVHDLMKELRQVVNEYPQRMMVGESDDIAFYGSGEDELHLNFNFPLMRTRHITPQHVRENQTERLSKLPAKAWPCNTLGNHDTPRMRNQFGDGVHDEAINRINLMLLLTLKGTPFLFNGEELGMSNVNITSLKDFVDPIGPWVYDLEKRVMGADETSALRIAAERSRDKGRNPMQWSSAANGGFSPAGTKPWLPLNPDFAQGVNYEDEVNCDDSTWNYYRKLIAWRRSSPALQLGEQAFIDTGEEALLAYTRTFNGETCLVLLNMGDADLTYDVSPFLLQDSSEMFFTQPVNVKLQGHLLKLAGHTGAILKNRA
jgi:alpha-glucosidase